MVDHRGIWTVRTAKFIFNATILLFGSHLINRKIHSTLQITLCIEVDADLQDVTQHLTGGIQELLYRSQ